MENLNIILPAVLLIIGFLLKLLVGRNWDVPTTVQAICELPVDIIFLGLSFCVGYTISNSKNQSEGLLYCYVGIAIAIIIVLIWRLSLRLYSKQNKFWILLLVINLSFSGIGIRKSINLINEDKKTNSEAQTNTDSTDKLLNNDTKH